MQIWNLDDLKWPRKKELLINCLVAKFCNGFISAIFDDFHRSKDVSLDSQLCWILIVWNSFIEIKGN